MAIVTNAYTTKQSKGNREQLEGVIYNIDPTDTPIFNIAGRRNVQGITYDWQVEKLPDPADNATKTEAYVFERAASTNTTRLMNTTQLNSRNATVSGDQQAADHAGIPDMMAHQKALVSKAIKLDIEGYFAGAQARRDETGANGSVTEGFLHALKTNVSRGTGGSSAADAYGTVTAGTARELNEDLFDDVLQAAWENGARCSWAFCGGAQKRKISKFEGRANGKFETPVGKLAIGGVNLLMSDFGDIKIALSRKLAKDAVLIVDPDYIKTAYYRPFEVKTPGSIGDAETVVIQTRWGVQVSNEAAHALIADLTV